MHMRFKTRINVHTHNIFIYHTRQKSFVDDKQCEAPYSIMGAIPSSPTPKWTPLLKNQWLIIVIFMDFWEKRNHTTDSCGPIAKITGHAFHDGIPICLDMKRCYLQDKARQAPDCFSCMKWQSLHHCGGGGLDVFVMHFVTESHIWHILSRHWTWRGAIYNRVFSSRDHHMITIPYTRNKLPSWCTNCTVCY